MSWGKNSPAWVSVPVVYRIVEVSCCCGLERKTVGMALDEAHTYLYHFLAVPDCMSFVMPAAAARANCNKRPHFWLRREGRRVAGLGC